MIRLIDKIKDFIKPFEGLVLKAYQDVVGIWTIGYGYTKNVKKGMVITKQTAEVFLEEEAQKANNSLHKLTIVPLNENQEIALTDFIYNLGSGAFQRSTLRMQLNRGCFEGAAKEILKWDKAQGKVIAGLTKRRLAEFQLFVS